MNNREKPNFPEAVTRLAPGESFCFDCHPAVPCFTECCRLLELELTPYDVLRLRYGTGLTSQQLHDRYIIEELSDQGLFPKYYLTMIDDGRASCAFVSGKGCTVYEHRPGACRAYPLGRAAMRGPQGDLTEYHVLLKENHCLGFAENKVQDAAKYTKEQGLDRYNIFNDAVASVIQHPLIRSGTFKPSPQQIQLYTLALYNIDSFSGALQEADNDFPACPDHILDDDEELLRFGIELLQERFFQEK